MSPPRLRLAREVTGEGGVAPERDVGRSAAGSYGVTGLARSFSIPRDIAGK